MILFVPPYTVLHITYPSVPHMYVCVFLPHLSVRPVNKKSFLQHVEDLCANDNAKFQEEFAVRVFLPTGQVLITHV